MSLSNRIRAARTDDADEPTHHQLRRQGASGVVAADHASQLGWQPLQPIGDSSLSRRRGLRLGECHRCDKEIPSTGNSHDVAGALSTIPERTVASRNAGLAPCISTASP